MITRGWWARRAKRRNCFHHDRNERESWIKSALINTGAGKMFWCTECEQTWFV